MQELTLLGALLAGLMAGGHCATMCGPFAMSLSALRAPMAGQQVTDAGQPVQFVTTSAGGSGTSAAGSAPVFTWHALAPHLAYSTGRIVSYALMGLLAGIIGAGVGGVTGVWIGVQSFSLALTAIGLLLVGAYLLGWRRAAVAMEAMGRVFWRFLQPLAQRSLRQQAHAAESSRMRQFARLAGVGSVWGFIPCGMVYGMLVMALASASPVQGMLLLLAFGLGTLPNLLVIGGLSHQLSRGLRLAALRRTVGGLILLMGVFALFRLVSGAAFSNGPATLWFGG